MHATGKPVVFVNCSGSAMAMPWEEDHCGPFFKRGIRAKRAGGAVAERSLATRFPPGVPVTFYRSTADLPPFEDYAMSQPHLSLLQLANHFMRLAMD